MYFAEWLWWLGVTERKNEKIARRDEAEKVYESEYQQHLKSSHERISSNPRLLGPVYVCNAVVLELRCGMFEPWRGVVTIISLIPWLIVSTGFEFASHDVIGLYKGSVAPWDAFWGVLICGVPSLVVAWLYLRYGIRLTRLEALTSRHLLVRFNRKTQQVYLHRPKYCGGIVALPWGSVAGEIAPASPSEADETGRPITMIWPPEATGLPHQEMVSVGRQSQGGTELRDQWEYIRRFMEEGPEDMPKPPLTSHFPWPSQAFTAQFEGISRFLRETDSPLVMLGVLLISPAFLCIGAAHWVSLLLCWKPRWPKVIREAGQPGKPVPKLTTIDDYPPDVRERLLANADQWKLKPGSRPRTKAGASQRKARAATAANNADGMTPPAD